MKTLKTKLTELIGLTPIHSLLACRLAPALRRSNVNVLFAAALLAILTYGCKKEKEIEPAGDFDQYVAMMSTAEQVSEVDPPQEIDDPLDTLINNVNCTIKKYHWAPGYPEPLLLNPTTDVVFPGAMLGAESITKGKYALITGDRGPITMSISLSNLPGNVSATANKATLSEVRKAVQSILDSGVVGATPAAHTYEVKKIYTQQQLNVAIGANYDSWFGGISAGFDFNKSSSVNRYLVKFFQVYYSVDIDIPDSPSDFWNTTPSASILGNHTPVYVSSVKYGRTVLCTFESSYSSTEIEAMLKGSFGGFIASGSFSVETGWESILNNSSMKIFVMGGSAPDGVNITNFNSLEAYIKQGGNYSNNSPGLPLSYTLRFLNNNEIARIVLSSDYSVQTCTVPQPSDPKDSVITINPSTMSRLCPERIIDGADADFGSNGARIWITVSAKISSDKKELMLYIEYNAKELGGDGTKAKQREEWRETELYQAPSGWTIKSIDSDNFSVLNYLDKNYNTEFYSYGASERKSRTENDSRGWQYPYTGEDGRLVDVFTSNGSTNALDVDGSCKSSDTYLSLTFNPIKITIRK